MHVASTRPPTCSTRCPNPCRPKPRAICTPGWPRLGPTPKPPSTSSSQPTAQNTTRPGKERLVKDRERLLSFYALPGRALEAHPHHQPHRKHLRHGAPEDREDQGVPEPQDGARHGLQTDLECQAEMAEAGRIKSTRRTRRRSAVQGRNQDNQTRRLIAPSPTFGHSSVANPGLFKRALDEDVMGVSLLRSITVRSVEGQFRRILGGGAALINYSFLYEGPEPDDEDIGRLLLNFEVTPDSTPPTNVHVLVGRNGVGKTYLLNAMTRALVLPEENPEDDGISHRPMTSLLKTMTARSPMSSRSRSVLSMTSPSSESHGMCRRAFAIRMLACVNGSRTRTTNGSR